MSNHENELHTVSKTAGYGADKRTLGVWVFRTREAARAYARTANKRKVNRRINYKVGKAKWGPEQ